MSRFFHNDTDNNATDDRDDNLSMFSLKTAELKMEVRCVQSLKTRIKQGK